MSIDRFDVCTNCCATLKKNVALVSPSTLMMSLKTVNHIWNTERQNKNTEEIVRQANPVYSRPLSFHMTLMRCF
jgi:DNA anti-recombination protein RmuC